MLIEVPNTKSMDTIETFLMEGVMNDRIDGYFTLSVDGEAKSDGLPDYMDSEKNLSEWVASFERVIMRGDRKVQPPPAPVPRAVPVMLDEPEVVMLRPSEIKFIRDILQNAMRDWRRIDVHPGIRAMSQLGKDLLKILQ